VADNEPHAGSAIACHLARRYAARVARSVDEVPQLIARFRPDVLLLALHGPGSASFGLVRRACRLRPGMACIVMTAYPAPASAAEAKRLGARAYLKKPLDLDGVETAVERALARQRGSVH
jgi:two-component system response regulator AtoC